MQPSPPDELPELPCRTPDCDGTGVAQVSVRWLTAGVAGSGYYCVRCMWIIFKVWPDTIADALVEAKAQALERRRSYAAPNIGEERKSEGT